MTQPPPKRKDMLLRQSEVDYTTVSPETGSRQCANCRWFCASGWDNASNSPTGAHCQIVEGYPLAILPTGLCNRHEVLPADANEFPPMEVVIVDVEVTDLEVDEVRMYAVPKKIKAHLLKRLIGGKDPRTMYVWKEADGLRRMLLVTSNNYEDREEEIVTGKALTAYVNEAYDSEGNYIAANKLLFYHKKALFDIGDIISADMIEGFLVEVGKERADNPYAYLFWDYIETTAADGSVEWGASQGFRAKKQGDSYVRIKKEESTVLDVEDAANINTLSGVLI